MRRTKLNMLRGAASIAIVAVAAVSASAQTPSFMPLAYPPADAGQIAPSGPAISATTAPSDAVPQNPYATPYVAQNPYAAPQGPYGAPQGASPLSQGPMPQGAMPQGPMPQGPYATPQSPYASPQAQYVSPQDSYYPASQGQYVPPQNGVSVPPGQYPSAAPQGPYPGPQVPDASPYGQPGPEHALSEGCSRCACPWSFRVDEVFMQRSSTRNQTLFIDPNTGADVLNSQTGLNFPVATGFQVGAARQMTDCWSLEVGYFQLDGWNSNRYLPDPSVMFTDRSGPFFPMDVASARYTSAIYLGELNVRQQVNEWFAILAGFRMGELDERYRATGAETFIIPTTASLTANASNHLYGFQVGAVVQPISYGPVKLDAICKAGVYENAITQASHREDLLVDDRASGSVNQLAFLGEAGLVLSYQLNAHLTARAVYQAVWMTGVALAPEQIPVTDFATGTTAIDSAGSLFYHGGGVGLELKY